MDEFEMKYGIQEDEGIIKFHKSRRMFCIYQENYTLQEKIYLILMLFGLKKRVGFQERKMT